jgi:hypothetical protein
MKPMPVAQAEGSVRTVMKLLSDALPTRILENPSFSGSSTFDATSTPYTAKVHHKRV